MTEMLDRARQELALLNRLLSNENVLDAFGHVSLRHPENPTRYLLASALAPDLVRSADILEFDLDDRLVAPSSAPLYSERVIHGAIYKRRRDVNAICHHHAPAIMPFCVSGSALLPVSQHGAVIGRKSAYWDSRDGFGDTNLLVVAPEEGCSLADALGDGWIVLMARHGATVVGQSLRELAFRVVYSCRNAEIQSAAALQGRVNALSEGEYQLASRLNPAGIERAWAYWTARLARQELTFRPESPSAI